MTQTATKEARKREILSEALSKMSSDFGEFMTPGLRRYEQDYSVLRELYDELVSKIETKSGELGRPVHFVKKDLAIMHREVGRELEIMRRHIDEGNQGYSFSPINVTDKVRMLAFYEKYFVPEK